MVGVGVVILAGALYLIINFQRSGKDVKEQVIPQLQLAQMQVTNLTADRANVRMNMIIDNPTPVGLDIDSLYYTVYIEGNEVVKTTYPDPLHIEGSGNTTVSLPLTIYYDKLQSVLKKLEEEGKDSVVYKVNAILHTDLALIPKEKFDLEVEKKMPLIRAPEIKVTDIRVDKLNFSGAVIQVKSFIVNKNVFSLGFENMDYSFQIEDNEIMEGHKSEKVKIEPKDSATIAIPVELNFKEMGKGLVDLIKEGGDLQYNFNLRTKLVSDAHFLEEGEMTLNATGKLNELAEVAKEQISEEK